MAPAKKKSKNKKKTRSKSSANHSNVIPMKKTKKATLNDRLQDVYHNFINLQTTCNGNGVCCKVACPQMNYCEFINMLIPIWDETNDNEKLDLVTTSLDYFFRYDFEKFGMKSLVKPCMLLGSDGRCTQYDRRPLNCRMYGQWPQDDYIQRVDRFAEAYDGLLERDELPLNTQCPFVKRVDDSIEITTEAVEALFDKLTTIDSQIIPFSDAQLQQKENYRTFHDWLLLKVLGEDWLSKLTTFMLAADTEAIEDQVRACKEVFATQLMSKLPALSKGLSKEIDEWADNVAIDEAVEVDVVAQTEIKEEVDAEIEKHPTALFFRAKELGENDSPNSSGDYFSETDEE